MTSFTSLISRRCDFHRFFEEGKRAKQAGVDASHFMYDKHKGGILLVPANMNDEFLSWMAQDLDHHEKLYITENKSSPVFRMYFDVDMVKGEDQCLPSDEICSKVLSVIRESLRPFFPDEGNKPFFDMIAMQPDLSPDDEKRGFHLVLPNMHVTESQAEYLHAAALHALKKSFPTSGPDATYVPYREVWEKILDPNVYEGNRGLRMPGCRQLKKCPDCQASQTGMMSCMTCYRTGAVDTGRVYKFWKFLSDSEDVDIQAGALKNNWAYLLKRGTIRVFSESGTNGFQKPPGCAVPVRSTDRRTTFTKHQSGVPRGDPIWVLLEKLIPATHRRYADLDIKSIVKSDMKSVITVKVVGPGARYCNNIAGEHKSSDVYFVVTPSGIHQKCWCRCESLMGRLNGLCKHYQSRPFPITSDQVRMLFSNTFQGSASKTVSKTTAQKPQQVVGPWSHAACDDLLRFLERSVQKREAAEKAPAEQVQPVKKKARQTRPFMFKLNH